MPRFKPALSLICMLGLGLSGCAAPIKMLGLLEPKTTPSSPESLALTAASESNQTDAQTRDALKIALEKKAAMMRQSLKTLPARPSVALTRLPDERQEMHQETRQETRLPSERQPNTHHNAQRLNDKPAESNPAGRLSQVMAMLSRAKAAPEPIPRPAQATHAPPSDLANTFLVKDETRISAAAPSTQILFDAGRTDLSSENNATLARFITQEAPQPGHIVVVTVGLGGSAPASKRMMRAAKRAQTLAQHVPPPMVVERHYDPLMPETELRLSIKGRV